MIHDDESNLEKMEIEDLENDIGQLDDVSCSHFVTRSEYHYEKMDDHHETYNFEQDSYIPDICQEIQKKSYGLRSRIKQASQGKNNVKNILAKQGLYLEKKQD